MAKYDINSLPAVCFFLILISCSNSNPKPADPDKPAVQLISKPVKKPASSYQDTLIIDKPAVVFYHPDSLQLAKIKAQTDSTLFDGSMHEFFYQMRNARMVIKRTWPDLTVIESKNYRHLLFIKDDTTREYIDLDSKNDAYGLFVFNRKRSPLFVDVMNIETEVSFYLKK